MPENKVFDKIADEASAVEEKLHAVSDDISHDVAKIGDKLNEATDGKARELADKAAEIKEKLEPEQSDEIILTDAKIEVVNEEVKKIREDTKKQVEANKTPNKVEKGLTVFGILNLIAGCVSLYGHLEIFPAYINAILTDTLVNVTSTQLIIFLVYTLFSFVSCVLFIVLGIRLIRGNRRKAGLQTNIMLFTSTMNLLCIVMLQGISTAAWVQFGVIVYLGILHAKIDPALRAERALEYNELLEETRIEQEAGVLGRDLSRKGYMRLDFFNLFWIWVLGCFVGCAVETVYCFLERGVIENRTGLLWGWWSPIYGFGGAFMSIILNRYYKSNILIIFILACIIGAGTEFAVSWFMETSFGIKAWDYSGQFMNIDGRTDLFHAMAFGAMGTIWVKWLQPKVLKLINSINWKWRYVVTTIFAAFMITNGAMTLLSIDCWVNRVNGTSGDTPVEQFFAKEYPNDWMQNHFQTMGITKNVSKERA